MPNIVYVLTNLAMPGLVKIGKTDEEDILKRMKGLYKTGVPQPFKCEYAIELEQQQAFDIERALHTAFQPYRRNLSREFFEIEPEQAKAILEILDGKNVTPRFDVDSREAFKKTQSKRPRFKFDEMGIPDGAKLTFFNEKNPAEAKVVWPNRVIFQGKEMSFTRATQTLLNVTNGVQPCSFWEYEGQNVGVIYEETYGPRKPRG